MERMVLARAGGGVRANPQSCGPPGVFRYRYRSAPRIAGDARVRDQAASGGDHADAVSVFRFDDAGEEDFCDWRGAGGGALAVAFAADHVDHAEGGDDVRDHAAYQHFVERAHPEETWRAHADAIGAAAAVAHDVKSQLAVAAFDFLVHFAGGALDALHC